VTELAGRRLRDSRQRAASYGHNATRSNGGRRPIGAPSASQGQQRILTLALRSLSWNVCVMPATHTRCCSWTNVSSELDPAEPAPCTDFLRETQSQVFVTTTRPELFPTPGASGLERADWQLVSGHLQKL